MSKYLTMDEEEFTKIIAGSSVSEIFTILEEIEQFATEEGIVNKAIFYYTLAQSTTYWKKKDITLVAKITEKAIDYVNSLNFDPSLLLSPVYYNIASFTLPWWSDSLDLDVKDTQTGLLASERLVELRVEQNDEEHKLAGAHWILAGHYLYTQKNAEKAIDTYKIAIQFAESSGEEIAEFMRAQSVEGIGRTLVILNDNWENAFEYLDEAEKFYKRKDDDYSQAELNKFRNRYS